MSVAEIPVRRERIYRRGPGPQWYWVYYATGPDGTRFDNRSIVELRRVLRRHYPDARTNEPWRAR